MSEVTTRRQAAASRAKTAAPALPAFDGAFQAFNQAGEEAERIALATKTGCRTPSHLQSLEGLEDAEAVGRKGFDFVETLAKAGQRLVNELRNDIPPTSAQLHELTTIFELVGHTAATTGEALAGVVDRLGAWTLTSRQAEACHSLQVASA